MIKEGDPRMPTLQQLAEMSDDELLSFVQKFMAPRYEKGYVKGVHDQDATKIIRLLLR